MSLPAIDLTTAYPASVRDELFGVVQLKRTIDKGIALAHGQIGEYHYNCPMDQAIFAFLGIDHEQLLARIRSAGSVDEIYAYVKPFVEAKSPDELRAWNETWLASGPQPGSESEGYFLELRSALDPSRTDITSWPDLLDLDEKRTVPRRSALPA